MIWSEIEIKTTPEAEEAVTELFYAAGAEGVVVQSLENLLSIQNDPTINYIDEGILNMDSETVVIQGYFSDASDIKKCVDEIKAGVAKLPEYGLNAGEGILTVTEVADEDWANSWKAFYKPTRIGKNIVVKPTWEIYDIQPDDLVINMDPGMAFGTGTHETTKLCVTAMEETVQTGDRVIDIGCGTGILSIIAAKLGADAVIGVDLDPIAVRVARENLILNGVEDQIEIREGDLVDVLEPDEKANVIVANILAEAIVVLSQRIRPFLEKNGIFIASGIICERLDMVSEALEKNDFKIEKIENLGEWHSIVARLEG